LPPVGRSSILTAGKGIVLSGQPRNLKQERSEKFMKSLYPPSIPHIRSVSTGPWAAVLGLLFVLTGCAGMNATGADHGHIAGAPGPVGNAMIANPASVNCIEREGTLTIRKRGDGGEYGICTFTDGRQCEEWALMRGECPTDGIQVTGFDPPEARYCAITGGSYTVIRKSSTEREEGRCTFSNGHSCDAGAYYEGKCPRSP
jgi:putative hemolysin